jgi:hypothetical protein
VLLFVVVFVCVQEEVLLTVFDEALQTDIYAQEQDWIRQEHDAQQAAANGAAADEEHGKPLVPPPPQQQPSQLLQHELSQQQHGHLQQQHSQQQQQRRHQTPEVQQQQQQFFGQGMRGPSPILTPPPGTKLYLRNIYFTCMLPQWKKQSVQSRQPGSSQCSWCTFVCVHVASMHTNNSMLAVPHSVSCQPWSFVWAGGWQVLSEHCHYSWLKGKTRLSVFMCS